MKEVTSCEEVAQGLTAAPIGRLNCWTANKQQAMVVTNHRINHSTDVVNLRTLLIQNNIQTDTDSHKNTNATIHTHERTHNQDTGGFDLQLLCMNSHEFN